MSGCDGSGIISEWYVDVDRTEVIKCDGCEACNESIAEMYEAALLDAMLDDQLEALPMWAGLGVQDAPPIPIMNTTNARQKVA